MGQTIAEALREEGMIEGELKGKRQTLLLLLRQKFGRKVTPAVVASIEKTSDLDTLDQWLAKLLNANTLDVVGIPARKH